jgi:hypothetical protein
MPVSSDVIGLGRITAGRSDISVWVRRAVSAVAWSRSHLICHWLQASSLPNTGSLVVPNPRRGMTMVPWLIAGLLDGSGEDIHDVASVVALRVLNPGFGVFGRGARRLLADPLAGLVDRGAVCRPSPQT